MLNKLEERIVEVWGRVYEGLSKNELDRRLARRRQPICMWPPRAWCLAIKASDRRIDEYFGWDSRKNQYRDGPQDWLVGTAR